LTRGVRAVLATAGGVEGVLLALAMRLALGFDRWTELLLLAAAAGVGLAGLAALSHRSAVAAGAPPLSAYAWSGAGLGVILALAWVAWLSPILSNELSFGRW